ncbi:hypothetical protein CDAR_491071 [Caerostris darwini]|uniref:HSF-type DNA-binding domain-containing protein n=1 Tax=Caerostris darwini TaxID=1538125 RepID=A0AAV4XAR8_9ARAC|nr:hypothetical protein CDAR_491071 [Caerostris darwini]
MISELLIQALENTPFQLKLFILATRPEVTYIQWSKCGNTVIVDSIEIINEGCASLIFNVDNFEQLLQSFSRYNFEIINTKSSIWEFKHMYLRAEKEDLLASVVPKSHMMPSKEAEKSKLFHDDGKSRITEGNMNGEIKQETSFQRTEENAEFECQNAGQSTTYEAVDNKLSMQQSQEQTENSDTLSANDTANNSQTAENLFDGKCDASQKKRSSESRNASNYVKGQKDEISNRKKSYASQASMENGSISNTSKVHSTKKAASKTNEFIIENPSRQILANTLFNRIYIRPSGKQALLEIQVKNGTIYHNSGRKRIRGSTQTFNTTDTILLTFNPSTFSSNQDENSSTCLPASVSVVKNKEIRKDANMCPNAGICKNLPQSEVLRKNDFNHSFFRNGSQNQSNNVDTNSCGGKLNLVNNFVTTDVRSYDKSTLESKYKPNGENNCDGNSSFRIPNCERKILESPLQSSTGINGCQFQSDSQTAQCHRQIKARYAHFYTSTPLNNYQGVKIKRKIDFKQPKMDQQPCFKETQVNKAVHTPNTYADVHCYSKSGYEFKPKPMVNQSNPFQQELLVSNDSNRNECANAQPYDTNTCHTLKELQHVEKKQKVIELEVSSDLDEQEHFMEQPKESNSADYQLKQNSKDSQHNVFPEVKIKQEIIDLESLDLEGYFMDCKESNSAHYRSKRNSKDSQHNVFPEMKIKQEIIDLESPDLHEQKYFMEHKVSNDCETRINSGYATLFPEVKIKQEIIDLESPDLHEQKYFMEHKVNNSADGETRINSGYATLFPEVKIKQEIIDLESPDLHEQKYFMEHKMSNSTDCETRVNSGYATLFPEVKIKQEIIDLESPDLHEQKYFMEHKVSNSTDCETRVNSGYATLFPEVKIKQEIIDIESLDLEGYFMDCKESNSANYQLKQNSKDSQHNTFSEVKIKQEVMDFEPPNLDEQEHFMEQPKESNSAETSNTHAATNSRSDCQGSRFQQELITPEYSSLPCDAVTQQNDSILSALEIGKTPFDPSKIAKYMGLHNKKF